MEKIFLLRPVLQRILGIIAVIFYLLYSYYYISENKAYNMVWVCHIGCLLAGVGLLTGNASVNAIGFFWVSIGTPLWIINLTAGSQSVIYSFLTHWGGLICGLYGIIILGLPRFTWIRAGALLVLFVLLSKFITPPAENINLIHRIWDGWENFYPSFTVYLLAAFSYCLLVFFIIEKLYSEIHAVITKKYCNN